MRLLTKVIQKSQEFFEPQVLAVKSIFNKPPWKFIFQGGFSFPLSSQNFEFYVYSCSESIEVLHCWLFPIEQSVEMEILLILFYYHEKIAHQVLLVVISCSLFQ
jgi:hypothetical protein